MAAGRGGGEKLRDPEMVDYWAVLGLERGAGPDNVKAAYRRLQKTYHPDSPMVRLCIVAMSDAPLRCVGGLPC